MKTAQEILKQREKIFDKRITKYGEFISKNLEDVVNTIINSSNVLDIDSDTKYFISMESFSRLICGLDSFKDMKKLLDVYYSENVYNSLFKSAVIIQLTRQGFTVDTKSNDIRFYIK